VSDIFDGLRELTLVSALLRVMLAVLIGGIVGMERAIKNQPAGFRTYMLVCLGASLVMMTNQYICYEFHSGDPSRLGAQVISGIGFLGAGSIIVTRKNQVRGLTTAAGLWTSACTGLAIGVGYYEGAILVGTIVLVIMTWLQKIDVLFMKNAKIINLYLNFVSVDSMNGFVEYTRQNNWRLIDIQIDKSNVYEKQGIVVFITLKNERRFSHVTMIQEISGLAGLNYVEEI